MRKHLVIAVMVAGSLFTALPASAVTGTKKTGMVEAGGGTNTSPGSGWSSSSGLSLGFIYRLSDNGGLTLNVSQNTFSRNSGGTSLGYTRTPLFAGARHFFWNKGALWSHIDVGVEYSMDRIDSLAGGAVSSKSESNIGAAAAYGLEYELTPALVVGLQAKYHLVGNQYWSYGIFVGGLF